MASYDSALQDALDRSFSYAQERRHEHVTLEHLLLALLDDVLVIEALGSPLARDKLRASIITYLEQTVPAAVFIQNVKVSATLNFDRTIRYAASRAEREGVTVITPLDIMIATFAEYESYAAQFLKEAGIMRAPFIALRDIRRQMAAETAALEVDTDNRLAQMIKEVASSAPTFREVDGRFSHAQEEPLVGIAERKAAAKERCVELQSVSGNLGNIEPILTRLIDRYAVQLETLNHDVGLYDVFLTGIEIQTFITIKSKAAESDENPPLNFDVAFRLQAMMLVHASLMSLFPEARQNAEELDRYQGQSLALDAVRNRILDPILLCMADSAEVFDDGTRRLSAQVKHIGDVEHESGLPVSVGASSAQHAWVRGGLASLATFALNQIKGLAKAVRDAVVREAISAEVKNKGGLTSAVYAFFLHSRGDLIALSDSLPSSFGWIKQFLHFFGIHT